MCVCAQTAAKETQLLIESKLEKKRKTRFGAPYGKQIVVFVDDVNMPQREEYGAQPPIELLRQFQVCVVGYIVQAPPPLGLSQRASECTACVLVSIAEEETSAAAPHFSPADFVPLPNIPGIFGGPSRFMLSQSISSITAQSSSLSRIDRKRRDVVASAPHFSPADFVFPCSILSPQDFGGFYDRAKLFWKDVEETTIVSACGPPGGGRQELTPRFVRHFNMLSVPPPSETATKTILSSILGGFLGDFQKEFKTLLKPIVDSSVDVYTRIAAELLPTPAKSHYTFNLRDLSKVFQGLLMIRPQQCAKPDVMMRLWVHEACRVFHDRLIDNTDKTYFLNMIVELLTRNFQGSFTYQEMFEEREIVFGDFLKMGMDREDRRYEEVRLTYPFVVLSPSLSLPCNSIRQ